MNRLLAALRPHLTASGDAALLDRFRADRDEAAFAELVRRYGPVVWGACRRGLANPADAEDAFQAAFLVLVRRADRLADHPALGPWLHRVAVLTVRNLRRANRRRAARTSILPHDIPTPDPTPTADARADLDAALAGLPERLRVPVVLCHLQGLTRAEAAARLGCPEGTLSAHLAEALRRLRKRLGASDPALVLAVAGGMAVPTELLAATTRAAVIYATSTTPAAGVSPAVAGLTQGVLGMYRLNQWAAAAAVVVMAAGLTVWAASADSPRLAQQKEKEPVKKKPEDPRLAFDAELAKERKFVVVGVVRSADGKTPLEGVEVWASAGIGSLQPTGETKTDKDGRFRLVFTSGILPVGGVAIVGVRKPGWHAWYYGARPEYVLSEKPLAEKDTPAKYTNLVPGKPSPLEFRMQPAAALRLKLLDAAGKPLANTRVWLTGDNLPPGASVIEDARTNAQGVFVVEDVPRSLYRVVVVGDRDRDLPNLELGSVHFKDAAEYSATATIHEWTPQSTHVTFKVTRGAGLDPAK